MNSSKDNRLSLSVELANIFSTSSLQHNWLVCIETQFSIGFFQIYFNFVLPGSHKIILKMTCFYYEVQNRFGQPSANPPLEKILKPVHAPSMVDPHIGHSNLAPAAVVV